MVLVNDIEIPQGVNGMNMTATGWYNLVSAGTRNGQQDGNFTDGNGVPQGDPYGSMAYLSVVVPNRINDGTSIPEIQVLMQGLKLWQFDGSGNSLGSKFSTNPAWVLLDVLMRCGYTLAEINLPSFATAATYCDATVSVNDPTGGAVQVPRFQCNFALKLQPKRGRSDALNQKRCANLSGAEHERTDRGAQREHFRAAAAGSAARTVIHRTSSMAAGLLTNSMRRQLRGTATEAPVSRCRQRERRIRRTFSPSSSRTLSISISRTACRWPMRMMRIYVCKRSL